MLVPSSFCYVNNGLVRCSLFIVEDNTVITVAFTKKHVSNKIKQHAVFLCVIFITTVNIMCHNFNFYDSAFSSITPYA